MPNLKLRYNPNFDTFFLKGKSFTYYRKPSDGRGPILENCPDWGSSTSTAWGVTSLETWGNSCAPAISVQGGGNPIVGSILETTDGIWYSDTGLIPPYTYQWYRGASAIVGATNDTYTLTQTDAGQNIRCLVTACDSDGCTSEYTNSLYILDVDANTHYNRVIADGGTIPLGLTALNDTIISIKNTYSVTNITDAFWALKPHWGISGIKTASGTGATAGGRATSVLYDICGVNGDFIQTTASAQPLALVHSGVNYFWSTPEAGNFMSSTTTYATSSFDVEFRVVINNSLTTQRIAGSGSGNPFSIVFNVAANRIDIEYYLSGYKVATCNTTLSGDNVWRVTRDSSTGSIVVLKNGVSQTVGGTQTAGALDTSITELRLCNLTGAQGLQGIMYYCHFYIGGVLTRTFNPASYNRATSQTSWVSATGETWTMNTASTNNALKAAIVDQTMIMGNGTSYGMRAPNLNINGTAITSYTVFRKFTNSTAQIITELSADYNSNQGRLFSINGSVNQEAIGIRANVGVNASFFTSNSLLLKVATAINNIANANESLPYLINNVSQSFVTQPSPQNNTTAMNATGYNFLARNNSASAWANVIAIGDIVVKGEDDTTKRTAMYNLLKTLSKI